MTQHRKPYKTYPKEFKLEALRMMEAPDASASKIALQLGLRRNQLYNNIYTFTWSDQVTHLHGRTRLTI